MDAIATTTTIGKTAIDRDVSTLAAGFAYYAFVSMIPLVIVVLSIASILGGEDLAMAIIEASGELLPPAGQDLLVTVLTTETGRREVTAIALVVAAWGGSNVFRGLSRSFDRIYADVERDTIFQQLIQAGLILLTIGFAILLMITVGTLISVIGGQLPMISYLSWLILFLGLSLTFLPVYYVLPPIPVSVREVIPGVVFAASGWMLLQLGFQVYAANASQYETYGVLGGVLLFVTWLYFAGLVLLVGGVINVVLNRPELAVSSE